MLDSETRDILSVSRDLGWVLEPEAKMIFRSAGLDVTEFSWVRDEGDAVAFANRIGYPVIAKIVSPKALHKSDVGGVFVDIRNDDHMRDSYRKLSAIEGFSGVLVENMVSGLELIAGAKIDYQFGPVILMGIGGTGVEIYKDSVFRMAPLKESDISNMIKGLKAHTLFEGYRGKNPVNMDSMIRNMLRFSDLVMELADEIDSVDINPLMCSQDSCVVADARIILKDMA